MNGSSIHALERKPRKTHVQMKAKSTFLGKNAPAVTDFGDWQSP